MSSGELECLADCGTTHTILRHRQLFLNLTPTYSSVTTMADPSNCVQGRGPAQFLLPNGTIIDVTHALFMLYMPQGASTGRENPTSIVDRSTSNREDRRPFDPLVDQSNPDDLRSFSTMLTSSNASDASMAHHSFCKARSLGKWGPRPSYAKDSKVLLPFLHRIQGDICGPIQPSSGPFKYFMVLVDASTRWSHVALLSTRNVVFAKLLAQIIRLRAHYPDHPIKSIRLDNAGEFTSKTFDDYCMSIGIEVEHPVPHVHTQNGLAEAAIKRIQMVTRTLVMRTNLPLSAWGHAVLHAAMLIRLRPTATQTFSAQQLVTGYEPSISHLRIFGCAVYVPITPPQRTKMEPQRRMSIYVGFESPTIIRYVEPLTGDLFTARFADCHFDEIVFPSLGGDKNVNIQQERRELSWPVPTLSHNDPPTAQ
ncbi:hypothetical protein M0R45_036177 [Rubus argutus]|uniref:Integrase catalytic domain-containing protein n=1 Tax=Rubus argutus TaxID=59490 RepID=A0AAW1VVB7_RUBAR